MPLGDSLRKAGGEKVRGLALGVLGGNWGGRSKRKVRYGIRYSGGGLVGFGFFD